MKGRSVVFGLAILLCTSRVHGQTFVSGSTGADGALEASDWQTGDVLTLPVPDSGIFNFTTVDVPTGKTLNFVPNFSNTPVVILAQGDVRVAGTIDVSGRREPPNLGRTPGPGGFFGGFPLGNGFGPGGGQFDGGEGRWVGPLTLVPIIGGSGGAGSSGFCGNVNGGGGGGALAVVSSTAVSVSGRITAFPTFNGFGNCGDFSNGAGGAIRLVANAVNVSGGLEATGPRGNHGVVRIEAPLGSRVFTGTSSPAAVISDINPVIVPTAAPTITIRSIGGFPVPPGAGSRPDTVDLLLPTQLTDPIPMIVDASNIPAGSQVTLAINGSPNASAAPATLLGSTQSSTATLSISSLDRTKVIFLFASVTFDVPNLADALNPAGPDRVARLRVQAEPGKQSKVSFLRLDGTQVAPERVPIAIRQLFGQ